jgi:putative tryptophan/tyrosine transport system substrate-binding protein
MRHAIAWRTALLPVILIVLVPLGLPRGLAAQRPGHVPRIAFLDLNDPPAAGEPTPFLDAFRHGLLEHGWVEGHTIAIEWRWAGGSLERFADQVAEVIRLPVEMLLVPNGQMARIAKRATSTIPILVLGAGSLQDSELVASYARPGGNVTGFTVMSTDLALTKLELLKEALPGVTRVAVLQGLTGYTSTPIWPAMEATARSLGVELRVFEVREPTAFDSAFAAMTDAQADALLVLPEPFFEPYRARIAALAIQHRLPSICSSRPSLEGGCLMAYGPDRKVLRQRAAAYVDKILKGASPADLPVEQPTKFELGINLKTAQALGLTLAPQFLFRADEVIR